MCAFVSMHACPCVRVYVCNVHIYIDMHCSLVYVREPVEIWHLFNQEFVYLYSVLMNTWSTHSICKAQLYTGFSLAYKILCEKSAEYKGTYLTSMQTISI